MKLKMILTALLAAASLNAAAEPFYWAGVSAGVNNRDNGTASTSSSWSGGLTNGNASETKANVTVRAGVGTRLDPPVFGFDMFGFYSAGVEANLTSLNGKIIVMPQLDYFWQPNGYMTDTTPIIMPHIGYSVATGAAGGLDVLIPLHALIADADPADFQTALRVGVTVFEKDVAGAKNMMQIGLVRSF